jgi:hypothetical protein
MIENEAWLRKQCSAFLGSKLTDDVLFEKAGMIRDAAEKRGISQDEVSAMYRKINNQKVTNHGKN